MQLIIDYSLGEIMAYFRDPTVIGWVLVGSGILAAIWLFENLTDPIPVLGWLFDGLNAVAAYLGFIVGALDILVGYVVYEYYPAATLVAAVLVVAGFCLVMRLLKKIPLALVFALAVAIFGTFTVYGILAPYKDAMFIGDIVTQIISLKGMIIIGLIIFTVAYVVGGLVIKLIQLIGAVFSSAPVSVLVGLGAIAVGIIVLVNPVMVSLIVT